MKKELVKEATEILKQLSPENQAYFMTLVKVAKTAEDNAKISVINKGGSCYGEVFTK